MIPALIGTILVILFAIPLFRGSRLNIGSATGFFCAGVLIWYGLSPSSIYILLYHIGIYPLGRILLWILQFLAAVVLILVIVESICMVRSMTRKPSPSATVIVLGCRVYGTAPSRSMQDRVNAAYAYLTEHEDIPCILSGGQGWDESISEADCMYQILTEKGIDPSRLYKEDRSTNTRENLLFSKELMEAKGFSTEVAIVTSDYHEYRSSCIARSLDLTPSAIPAKTAWWLFPTYYVRELYAILHMWLP